MTEAQIIKRINQKLNCSGVKNAYGQFGDDAFLIPPACANEVLVLSTDSFALGTHFNADMGYESAGWKSLVGALSDVYAMGAYPNFLSLNLSLPSVFKEAELDSFLNGLSKAAKKHSVYLLGGDVCRAQTFVASLQVGGYLHQTRLKSNLSMSLGDVLLTEKGLGESFLGFKMHSDFKEDNDFVKAFLFPDLNQDLGPWLGKQEEVTSLRDVSDGLYKELSEITDKKSMSIELEPLKTSEKMQVQAKDLGLSAEALALEGGEDYKLLWTVKPEDLESFFKKYYMKFKTKPILVGRFVKQSAKKITYENQDLIESIKPFEHFSS